MSLKQSAKRFLNAFWGFKPDQEPDFADPNRLSEHSEELRQAAQSLQRSDQVLAAEVARTWDWVERWRMQNPEGVMPPAQFREIRRLADALTGVQPISVERVRKLNHALRDGDGGG